MLISQFAQKMGLGIDTARYYVRIGLLTPGESAKGGRNPYQIFSTDDVRAAQTIQLCQALGMSLKEIGTLLEDSRTGTLTNEKLVELMLTQHDILKNKARDMLAMAEFLKAKIAWKRNEPGAKEPYLMDFLRSAERAA